MPCMKCEDGKWKWGHRGKCKYPSQSVCEQAHAGEYHEGRAAMHEDMKKKVLEGTAMVQKLFSDSVKGISELKRTATFTISTGAVDRDNDTIDPTGWDLKDYRKNPVVLWAHNPSMPPIGKAHGINVRDEKYLMSTATFATKEQHELADTVFQLILGGFLNTASVGFRPLESVWNEVRGGFDFKKQALQEWSVVPVPSNPEALVGAKEAGIDINVIFKWATDALDMLACRTSTRCELESVWKTLANPQIVVSGYQDDEVIQDALELANVDDGFKKALMVGLTGIDLDKSADGDSEDIVILQGNGNEEEVLIELDEPEEAEVPSASLNPDDAVDIDGIDLGSIDPGDLKGIIRDEIRSSLTTVHGRLPD